MKEHPILFSGEMVQAIQEGRKTQTRRVIKPQPNTLWDAAKFIGEDGFRFYCHIDPHIFVDWKCPYGQSGDGLWVREAWRPIDEDRPVNRLMAGDTIYYRADYVGEALGGKWRPSIHMPRWASRINLEIVNIRVERVQEIHPMDCIAEGATDWDNLLSLDTHILRFHNLWDKINLKRGYGWEVNPWVWIIEFKAL